ncbi:MAG: hypothetical protein ACYTG5_22940 [Planctomycetota bacterium]|jgi:hypothetical protein
MSSQSLYFFEKVLWDDPDLTPEFHAPLCDKLQQIPLRFLTCEFRGSLKSSRIRAAAAWIALENVNWSWLMVMNREENAMKQLGYIRAKMEWDNAQAQLLRLVYKDRFEGYDANAHRIILARDDPNAPPFFSIAGLDSKLESVHVSGLILDDLEGADEDKKQMPSAESRKFVFNRAPPLLIKQMEGPIWVSGTPHGDDSLVWHIRDVADQQAVDNPGNTLNFQYHWSEVLDEEGNSRWPERFPPELISTMQSAASVSPEARRMWDQQMMLRRKSISRGALDMDAIEKAACELLHGRLMRYPSIDADPRTVAPGEIPVLDEPKYKTVDLAYCRPFMHIDSQHKDPDQRIHKAESKWAILVTYVAPDWHTFLVDWWIQDASFDDALHAFFKLYRKHGPHKITMDAIGAQVWIKNYLRLAERTQYRKIHSLPTRWSTAPKRLGKPSLRVVEAERRLSQDKEEHIVEQLEGLFNLCWLHVPRKAEEVYEHMRNVGTGSGFLDAADALAQGPPVWKAPMSPESKKAIARREAIARVIQSVEPLTGYRDPYGTYAQMQRAAKG